MVVIAGEGPQRQALLDEAIRVGAQDRIALPGYRRDARALIGAADVVVINSSSEGLPLVAIESMMAGTPLVAAGAAWQKDVLNDGVDCLLVPWDDPLATARAVERLLDDPGLTRRISANARLTSAAYSASATVEAYLDLYRRLALPS
jgi:glycosyltransferase involved in cell wall biosynthesis